MSRCHQVFFLMPSKLQKWFPYLRWVILNRLQIIDQYPVLSNNSKIFEKLVCVRLNKYLTENHTLHQNQFGFHQKLSTCLALLQLVDELTQSIDAGNITVGAFVDLAKAFDTVDHAILFGKLNCHGIRGIPQPWFADYLTNRKTICIYTQFKFKLIKYFMRCAAGLHLGSNFIFHLHKWP